MTARLQSNCIKKRGLALKTDKKPVSPITIRSLVAWGNAKTYMSASRLKAPVGAVWMDSRKVAPGDVFVALKSDTDDGHNYVPSALKSGAVAAIVSKKKAVGFSAEEQKKLIIVSDPLQALQKMAAGYRKSLSFPIIAVTGSSGKTTTRQFITAVLSAGLKTGNTEGNWNNHIGVPLSVLRFSRDEDVAVMEFGANHKHEIDILSRIAKPDIGVITNIGYAHVGYFGSLEKTTEAKFEIVNGMNRRLGLLLLNGDDKRLVKNGASAGFKTVLYGFSKRCAVRAEAVSTETQNSTRFFVDGYEYCLSIIGNHFIYSALPAIYLGLALGLNRSVVADALRSLKPDPMRGRIEEKRGVTFIVDCYNANPSSMKSGIALLTDVAGGKSKCAIVGDMLELGRYSKPLHMQLGKRLADAGVEKIIAVGQFSRFVAEGAVKQGMGASRIQCVENADQAASLARTLLKPGEIVLLKGSRGVKLEAVFNNF